MASPLFYYFCFNSNFTLMATTAKRGRPAKKTVEAAAPVQAAPAAPQQQKKEIFKEYKPVGPTHHEYELTDNNGMFFLMKAGPISVYDEETDSIRAIRYIPKEDSIYVEEQTSKPMKQPIIFENGRLWVRRNQPNLKRFMDMHPLNQANGGQIFRKVDLSRDAAVDLNKEYQVIDALALIRQKPLTEILTVATAYAMDTDRPVDEIKHDLIQYAKQNPRAFIEAFDNPVIETKAIVKKAMTAGIIMHDKGHMRWVDNKGHILAIPVGQDPIEVFGRWCMTETGSVVLDEIKRQL
jgi:hypothetical protein